MAVKEEMGGVLVCNRRLRKGVTFITRHHHRPFTSISITPLTRPLQSGPRTWIHTKYALLHRPLGDSGGSAQCYHSRVVVNCGSPFVWMGPIIISEKSGPSDSG